VAVTTYNRGMERPNPYWERLRRILRGEPVSDGIPIALVRRTEGERRAYMQGHAAGKRAGYAEAAAHARDNFAARLGETAFEELT
jgi:hypothetical protein